jgi:hypothetical protein
MQESLHTLGQHAGNVLGEPAPGDVRHALDLQCAHQRKQGPDIDARGCEKRIAQ